MIEEKLYKKIVESVPLLTVDVVLTHKGKYLLVKRENEPLKGFYWVVGGRVLKDESIWEAAMRKIRDEVGGAVKNLDFIGFYEDSYSTSAFGTPTHTTSLVFKAELADTEIKLDSQSSDWILTDTLPDRFIHKLYEGSSKRVL